MIAHKETEELKKLINNETNRQLNNFSTIFLAICSSISNIGISMEVPKDLSFIFLILIIIGGSFFSTSSGIRFFKLLLLFKIDNLFFFRATE